MQRKTASIKHYSAKTANSKAETSFAKNGKEPFHKKDRKQFACPDALADLLAKIRWLDPKLMLKPLAFEIADAASETPLEYVQRRALAKCLESLPVELKEYVWAGQNPITASEAVVSDAAARYEDFRISRQKLSGLLELKKRFSNHGVSVLASMFNANCGGAGFLQIDENNIARVRVVDSGEVIDGAPSNSFDKAVQETNLDRIRECEICGHFFWASNKNSKTCSPPHANIARIRKSRAAKKEQRLKSSELVNQRQRENRANKKRIENLKGNRNGNLS
jgi:hypothetical protein